MTNKYLSKFDPTPIEGDKTFSWDRMRRSCQSATRCLEAAHGANCYARHNASIPAEGAFLKGMPNNTLYEPMTQDRPLSGRHVRPGLRAP
jgi:hypothetical protein